MNRGDSVIKDVIQEVHVPKKYFVDRSGTKHYLPSKYFHLQKVKLFCVMSFKKCTNKTHFLQAQENSFYKTCKLKILRIYYTNEWTSNSYCCA